MQDFAEYIHEYALKKDNVSEGFPFGEGILVMKVNNKVFMLLIFNEPFSLNLKCDPELALELRERYESVQPGYHMNKKHWNTVYLDGSIHKKEIIKMVDHSYELVKQSTTKKTRANKK
jgi:predicted DNA-binding protein (MmcQ/YjbR family)